MELFKTSKAFVIVIFCSILAVYTKNSGELETRHKTSYEFDYQTNYRNASVFQSRTTDAIDLYKEYKDSIYVDRYYNSSFALNIPLFTLTLPGTGRGVHSMAPAAALNIGNIAMLGLIVLGAIALVAPLIFPEHRKRSFESSFNIKSINNFLDNQLREISESVVGRDLKIEERHSIFYFLKGHFEVISEAIINSIDNTVERLPYFPRKKIQQCIKWCICDVHNKPKKYALIGILFRAIFPYYDSSRETSKVMTKYHLAANYGREGRGKCHQEYNGCSIDYLDIIQEVNHFMLNNKSKSGSKSQKNFIMQLIETYFAYK